MDQFIVSVAVVALFALGAALTFWPAGVIVLNRDAAEEPRAPTAREVRLARLLGLILMAGGGYILYALLTGMPGAEFFPA